MSDIKLARMTRIINKQLENYKQNMSVPGLEFEFDKNNKCLLNFKIKCSDEDTAIPWHGMTITGLITFPHEYPYMPPDVKFTCNLYHPNIYKDGKVCISILNIAQDEYKYFAVSELWSPATDIDKLMLSIWSMLLTPNIESPANVDASVDYRTNIKEYVNKTRKYLS